MKFGNWLVDEDGITWKGKPMEYVIRKGRLHEAGPSDRSSCYDWLVHMAEKTWLTRDDIRYLNEAFLYAFNLYEIGFAADLSWEETMEKQKRILANR